MKTMIARLIFIFVVFCLFFNVIFALLITMALDDQCNSNYRKFEVIYSARIISCKIMEPIERYLEEPLWSKNETNK